MLSLRLAAGLAAVSLITSSAPLRVIRVTPETPADPGSEVTVTFDRPVAGGLDESVDPASIFRIEPDVPGKIEWRDPLTLRFTPAQPLEPERTYRVTVSPQFQAMDGSSLGQPYAHTFTVSPPQVLAGDPVNANATALHVTARPTLRLLMSAPVDLTAFAARSSIVLDRVCGGGTVNLRGVTQRRISGEDPSWFRWSGLRGPMPDSTRDLRRVVELEPVSPLPLNCGAILRVPAPSTRQSLPATSWQFRTYGPLRVATASCATSTYCPTGPVRLVFSTPVSGSEITRKVHVQPAREYTVRDTTEISTEWVLDASLDPRRSYAVVIDAGLTDVFGQQLGRTVRTFSTTGFAPSIVYDHGRLLIEQQGLRTLPVQHVNVDTLIVKTAVVPDSLIPVFLGRDWNWQEPWSAIERSASVRRFPVSSRADDRRVTGVRLAPPPGRTSGLLAVQVTSPQLDSLARMNPPIALVQITNLGVHARIGIDQGLVWVTGVNDGLPRSNVDVELRDLRSRVLATSRTNAQGIAEFREIRPSEREEDEYYYGAIEGYVLARAGQDRAIAGINPYDPDLAPWRFGVWGAWERQRIPAAAAVFTERGIYRPGETVYAKAIVRQGTLGSLRSPAGDSIRWTFRDREGGTLRDSTARLSQFGTADARLPLSADLPLGWYSIHIDAKLDGEWKTLDETSYQVAEYRPPEFLVDANVPAGDRFAGDTADFTVSARYLFGAPMANSPVQWSLRLTPKSWGVSVRGAEDYTVGASANWWEYGGRETIVTLQGLDTLDATGTRVVRIPLPASPEGRPATATLVATVTDANRQTSTAAASLTVHPASFYLGARTPGDRWFWLAGQPVTVEVIAVRPDGERMSGVDVEGVVVRREWHVVRRVRGGQVDELGGWVQDTVARCRVRTAADPSPCTFTPPSGGAYTITFTSSDDAGRSALTTLSRWAAGPGFVPWNDESQLKMDVVPDKPSYNIGDTATVFFASPFIDAEAWVTVERERVLESRRIRVTSGATTLRFPITESHAPNVYVSILVTRGRNAPPGPLDDPGRPAIRVGYAQLRVLPAVKRLTVDVTPQPRTSAAQPASAQEPVVYEPGDTARVTLRVRDAQGRGVASEVTLWAVDEGVLALTGYQLPDPVSLIYQERGLGVRLASNLTNVAAQIPDGQKGKREAGGGGGDEAAGILRSRFQTTAFFLGSVLTDANGNGEARARLPDNLTTFRVMAVAVTNGDRYGSGQSEFLVTRPLVARPSLPRFVREGDRFVAGVVVNQRAGGTPKVEVEAQASGIRLEGSKKRSAQLAPGRGVEVRFDFRGTAGDSAAFQFNAVAGRDRDAVRVAIPVRPWYYPLSATVAGTLHDTATAEFPLHGDVDENRSRLEISFGSSAFAVIDGIRETMRVYPYYCSEQLSSIAMPLVALYRARTELGMEAEAAAVERDLSVAVRTLIRRQTAGGGIGFWSASDWSSPWLSAYAGRVLLEARDAGMHVDSVVLASLAGYLQRSLTDDEWLRTPVAWWFTYLPARLSERLAAADFLSRLGQPDIAVENSLLQQAARLRWEDRVLLAELLARRGELQPARLLLAEAWRGVTVAGRKAVLPQVAGEMHYFRSRARPAARLLTATLAVQPDHPLVGPLVETLVDQGRTDANRFWSTQDYGQTVFALLAFERQQQDRGDTRITVRGNGRTLFTTTVGPSRNNRVMADTSFTLSRLVSRAPQGGRVARITFVAEEQASGSSVPVWFYATVREVPKTPAADPIDRGIVVERWYEHIRTRQPIVNVREGELVRVRLRVTVPSERHFIVLDDPLPAGLEPVDLSLRTVAPPGATFPEFQPEYQEWPEGGGWWYGSWDSGIWSPFDHREMRDDRVVWSAAVLWQGQYSATYIARATTAGTFIVPPAHAEEMYNPGVNGRTGTTTFTVSRVQN